MKFFNKFKYEIKIPDGVDIEWFSDRIRFRGAKDQLFEFIGEFRKLSNLNNGDLVKLGSITLKVSDYLTVDRNKKHWIELPDHAWNIVSSKFYDVLEGLDSNPFDFNDCGYTDKNPFDIGIEITDLKLSDSLIYSSKFIQVYTSECEETCLIVEDLELFDFIDDFITEKSDLGIEYYLFSQIDKNQRCRIFVEDRDQKKLLKLLSDFEKSMLSER
ncbi:MAG: hypothetical protein AAGC88_11645 [Bacteroidota bacterium]